MLASGCGAALCTSCRSAYHAGFSCAAYQALPDEVRESAEDLAVVQYARDNNCQRCPGCGWVH
jgi:hypothetical protein